MSLKITVAVCAALVFVAGCQTKLYGTAFPQSGGKHKLTVLAKSEGDATRMAQHDASATCSNTTGNADYEMVDMKTIDVGQKVGGVGDAGVAGMAASLMQYAAKENSKENFKVEMVITCSAPKK